MRPERARHWQEAWARAGLATGQRREGHPKYYALVAYPGTSGFLHVGHLRGFAYADALARYHRMRGEAVLVPFGVHASGLPAVTFAQRVRDDDPVVRQQLDDQGVPPAERARLTDPAEAARYLGESYRTVLGAIGALVDPSTYLTTIDDDYRAFVRWQFGRLHAAGAVAQGAYFSSFCPVDGAVAVDPSETDLSSGGDAEVIRYTTVPFRLDDGRTLLAATLRPETLYGVTNLWVPDRTSLTVWHHGSGTYLATAAGVARLVDQHGGHAGQTFPASDLVGRDVEVPLTGDRVPILSGSFVDPSVGTGVVMSVPAHAPADAEALRALDPTSRARAKAPRVLLEVPESSGLSASEQELVRGEGLPAERALAAVRALAEAERVDAATERLYRLEYVRGRMTVPELAGVAVREARDRIAAQLEAAGSSFSVQEFSKPVRCRNGHDVVIRRVPDQWFLRYGDPGWKAELAPLVERLSTWPKEYGEELPAVVDWFQDRPCTRRGRWLGTPFPLDPGWVIEPIADSTFYMAYYPVRRFVSSGRLHVAQLTDRFFDFVFRGEGPGEPTVDRAVAEEVRAEFRYWYPLDLNIGGKEHKRVHFPVFLYTHARLLPPELWPKGIFVHGWITGPAGAKISKKEVSSKGGRIPPLGAALERWGADEIRLYYALTGSSSQDLEWDPAQVDVAAGRLEEVERLAREGRGGGTTSPELDAWLRSAAHRVVTEVRAAFDAVDLHGAAELVYVRVPNLLRRYYARGGSVGAATGQLVAAWVRLLAPITPHLAEELGEPDSGGLVATRPFPEPHEFEPSPAAEARERFLERVEEDLRAVLRPASERGEPGPEEAIFYVAAPWKRHVEAWMREAIDRGEVPSLKEVMARASSHPELTAYRAEIPKYVQRVAPLLRTEPPSSEPEVNEVEVLRDAEGYLVRRLGFPRVAVYRESEAEAHDPLGRRDRARPGRPAFYLVRPGQRSA